MRKHSALFLPALFATCFAVSLIGGKAWSQEDDGLGAVEITDSPARPAPQPIYSQPTYSRNSGAPVVGRRAAAKYMPQRNPNTTQIVGDPNPAAPVAAAAPARSGDAHYLAVGIGGYVSDTAYKWGSDTSQKNVGNLNLALTYRLGEWVNAADFAMRVDYSSYTVAGESANKLSFVPVILFPDASSKFPLYFGVGGGLGVFLKQLSGESALAFDYQLLLGARFFDLFNNAGLFVEAGLKNHLHILSDGQFNGTFVTVGSVFTF